MVHKLFQDFLESAERYEGCELYWERLVHDITNSLDQAEEWEGWIPRNYPDGTRVEMDGNPIANGRSRKFNRAFRVIQHLPVGNNLEIVAWIKTYGEDYYEFPRAELVINLSLSEESGKLARNLLEKWMTPQTTADEMQQFIRECLESEK